MLKAENTRDFSRGMNRLIFLKSDTTGSSHTVISPDILEEIGIIYEMGDDIYEAYGIGILYLSLHCPNLTLLILK